MSWVTFLSAHGASIDKREAHVISIGSEGEPYQLPVNVKNHIRLEFEDTLYTEELNKPFTREHADQIIDFVKMCKGEPIIVHCAMGMSRSAAVAKFVHDYYGYEFDMSKPCFGTTQHHNKLVYETLLLANGVETLRSYYESLQ